MVREDIMKIDIERLGLKNVPVDPQTLFAFPEGIAGFEDCKRFKLFHEEGLASTPTVFWLQSVDDPEVMFPDRRTRIARHRVSDRTLRR